MLATLGNFCWWDKTAACYLSLLMAIRSTLGYPSAYYTALRHASLPSASVCLVRTGSICLEVGKGLRVGQGGPNNVYTRE
jgi:hypothetical protein